MCNGTGPFVIDKACGILTLTLTCAHTGISDDDLRLSDAERSTAEALQKTAECLADIAAEDTESFIIEQRTSIADFRTKEATAAKERENRDVARVRPATSESQTIGKSL